MQSLKRWFDLAGSSGLLLLGVSIVLWGQPVWIIAAWLGLEVLLAELLQARLVRGEGLSFTTSVSLAGIWLYGPTTTMLAAMVGIVLVGFWRQRDWRANLFNVGQAGIRITVAYWAFNWLSSLGLKFLGYPVSALLYAGLNIGIMAVVFALHRDEPVGTVLTNHLRANWLPWLDRLLLGGVLVFIVPKAGEYAPLVAAFLILAASLVARSSAYSGQEQAVERLLNLAGARAPFRVRRAERMIRLAAALARELNLNERTLRDLRHAILLQDVGLDPELERRLERPGPLSPQDRRALLAYPDKSAGIISEIGDLVPVAETVRHAYERYDGFGYPEGLKGESIPLLSRLIAIVRTYESITSGRAYRLPQSSEEALKELQKEAGLQFDPRLVEACVRVVSRDPQVAGTGDVDEVMEQLRTYLTGERHRPGLTYSSTLIGLSSLAQQLGESLSLEGTITRASTLVGRLTGWPNMIHLTNDMSDALNFGTQWGFPMPLPEDLTAPLTAGLPVEAAWARQPLYSADIAAEVEATHPQAAATFRQMGVKSALAVPMTARNRVIGVICVFGREQGHFNPEQINLLTAVAGEAALALENARLFTEVERRYADLVAMQAFTDTLLRESNAAIIAWDRDGRVQRLNQTARTLLQAAGLLQQESAEGRLWVDLVHGTRLVKPLLETLGTGRPQDFYSATLDVGGDVRLIDIHLSPLHDRDRLIGAAAIAHDVTEHSRVQEHLKQVEKLAAVGELAAGAAHEIRNPLTAVRGFIQLLSRSNSGATEQEYVNIILGEIDRIDGLLEDLLTLARPTSQNRRSVDLHALLEDVVRLVQAKEVGRGVDIQWEWAAPSAMAQVDPRQMKQVFLNIVQNAAEAMHGEGRIILTSRVSPEDELVISCQDTGPGIPSDVLPRIFDPFFTTKDTGTGLGLPVSFRIVESHGGRMEVESREGLGATFRITLPGTRVSLGGGAGAATPVTAQGGKGPFEGES